MGGRVRPLVVLVSVVQMVLEVPLLAGPLIIATKELSVLLEVLLVHIIKPQVEASKLIRKELRGTSSGPEGPASS